MPDKPDKRPTVVQMFVSENYQINTCSDEPVAVGQILPLKFIILIKSNTTINDDILSANAEQVHCGANDASNFPSCHILPVLAKLAVPVTLALHCRSPFLFSTAI